MCARARRPTTLPDRQLGLPALHQLPLDIEPDSAQVQSLTHLVALTRRSFIRTEQAVVDRHPLAEAPRIHHERPDDRRGRGDVAGCDYKAHLRPFATAAASAGGKGLDFLPLAQGMLDRALQAVQAHVEDRGSLL